MNAYFWLMASVNRRWADRVEGVPLAFKFISALVGLFLFGFSHYDVKDIVSVSWFHRTNWEHWRYSLEALITLQWERRMGRKWHSKRSLYSFDVLIKGVLRERSEQTVGLRRRAKTVAILISSAPVSSNHCNWFCDHKYLAQMKFKFLMEKGE